MKKNSKKKVRSSSDLDEVEDEEEKHIPKANKKASKAPTVVKSAGKRRKRSVSLQ